MVALAFGLGNKLKHFRFISAATSDFDGVIFDQIIAAFKVFDRNMLAKIDFVLDDQPAKPTLIILSRHMHRSVMNFVSTPAGVGGIADGTQDATVRHFDVI